MELIGKVGKMKKIEVTFLLPCLNEEKTLAKTIREINEMIEKNHLIAEILVVDNGSTDNSEKIAKEEGARVIKEEKKGYGNALRTGFKKSIGKYIIMGDADTTYDFKNCMNFIDKLREGYDLVIGNRYLGGMEKDSMTKSHYYGVKALSYIAKKKGKVNVSDFHCGLRGINQEFISQIPFQTTGMEFATEMILLSAKYTNKITEVPTKLKKCSVERKPHLRTIRDGYRHLMYIIRSN